MVLELVPEERARAVDLLTSDNGHFLSGKDLLEERNEASVGSSGSGRRTGHVDEVEKKIKAVSA